MLSTVLERTAVLVLIALLGAACTSTSTPTATASPPDTARPPTSTHTPAPTPTPVPPTPTPITRIEVDDAPNDGANCVTGEDGAASVPLPAYADVTHAWSEVDEENGVYLFSVEFGRTESLDQRFIGGLHLYDPEGEMLETLSEDWYFNNTTNVALNFGFTPPDTINVGLIVIREGVWDAAETAATASINGNVFTFAVPIGEVAQNASWGWGLTNASYSVCERVGYGEDDRPSLPLPPRRGN